MNAHHLAALTLEVWRASGPRTEQRRDSLLTAYAESYYGPMAQWGQYASEEYASAGLMLRRNTRIDELVYA